jgi:arylsulfatase A-like enzyme
LLATRGAGAPLEAADLAHLIDLYDAQIREVDANLGRFFERLRTLGQFQDAFIALVADHGDEFQDHGGVMHGRSHYREILRVPLLVRDPAWPAGRRIATPVSTVDVVPTLLAALGAEGSLPETLDGRDLTPLALGAEPGERQASGRQTGRPRILYAEAVQNASTQGDKLWARQGRYALHLDVSTGSHQLFDLQSDPGEQLDLSDQLPELSAELVAALTGFAAGARADSERFDLTPRDRSELEALGYLAPSETADLGGSEDSAGGSRAQMRAALEHRN